MAVIKKQKAEVVCDTCIKRDVCDNKQQVLKSIQEETHEKYDEYAFFSIEFNCKHYAENVLVRGNQ